MKLESITKYLGGDGIKISELEKILKTTKKDVGDINIHFKLGGRIAFNIKTDVKIPKNKEISDLAFLEITLI